MKHFAMLLFVLSSFLICQSKEFIIRSDKCGVPNDGKTLCTVQLQNAIDRIAKRGGGMLVLAPGTYLTGGICLKSGVTLKIEKGATLLGSINPYDYHPESLSASSAPDPNNDNGSLALIMAHNAKHIAIDNGGVIDGNGLQLALNIDSLHHTGERVDPNYGVRRQRPSGEVRPKLFFFSGCDDVTVRGGKYRSSACWGLSFDLCSNMTLENLDIENRAYWNNDGIDITDCHNVRVRNCKVNSADDGICLKSYHPDDGNINIKIDSCEIRSSASAVKFGTGSWGCFKDIEIGNIRVFDTYRSAIAIESVDGGSISNVLVHDIYARNTGNPIFIRLGQRAGEQKGSIDSVTIRNLYCQVPFGRPDINYDLRGPGLNDIFNPIPCSITGIPESRIGSVTIENIEIEMPGHATKGMAYIPLWRVGDVPEKIKDYPEFSMFGELPSYGFYVRHVGSITFKNVRMKLAAPDYRPAIVLDDVGQVNMENVKPDNIFRK